MPSRLPSLNCRPQQLFTVASGPPAAGAVRRDPGIFQGLSALAQGRSGDFPPYKTESPRQTTKEHNAQFRADFRDSAMR